MKEPANQPKRAQRWWLFLPLAALPALAPLILILCYGFDLPYLDHWHPDMVGMILKSHDGTLKLSDLTVQHYEHRIFVPRLIFLALARLTNWNQMAEMFATWLAVCVSSAGILWLTLRSSFDRRTALVTWFFWNVLMFSPVQLENWIWGMGLTNVLPVTFMVTAMVVVHSGLNRWVRTALIILLCSAATFSFGNGILAWPVVMIVLAWSRSRAELKQKIPTLAAIAVGFAVNIAMYRYGYDKPELGMQTYATGAGNFVHFTLAFAGNNFAYTSALAAAVMGTVAGGVVLTLFLAALVYFAHAWLRRGDMDLCQRMIDWLALGGFSLVTTMLVAYCRAGVGVGQAVLSRYTTLSMFLPLTLVQVLPIVCRDFRQRRAMGGQDIWIQLPAALAAVMLVLQLLCLRLVLDTCDGFLQNHRQGKAALLLVKVLPDNPLIAAYVDRTPRYILEQAPLLDKIGYIRPPLIGDNVASKIECKDPGLTAKSHGALERIWQPAADEAAISGWAMLPEKGRPADGVFLTYDDAETGEPIIFAAASDLGRVRVDLTTSQGIGYLRSGWATSFPVAKLPPHMKVMIVTAWAMDGETGQAFRLSSPTRITR